MNIKGGMGIALIVAIMLFIIGLMSINFIIGEVTRARDASNLNCDSPTSDGIKLTCLLVDIVVPYFIIIILSTAGGLIIAKFTI